MKDGNDGVDFDDNDNSNKHNEQRRQQQQQQQQQYQGQVRFPMPMAAGFVSPGACSWNPLLKRCCFTRAGSPHPMESRGSQGHHCNAGSVVMQSWGGWS